MLYRLDNSTEFLTIRYLRCARIYAAEVRKIRSEGNLISGTCLTLF